jgi:hypothetical protein
LTNDRFGNLDAAYLFDGDDDFIEIPLMLPLTMTTNSFSVSCWIKTSMEHTHCVGIIGNYRPYTVPNWGQGLNPENPEAIMRCGFGLRDQDFNTAGVTTEFAVNDGSWHHLVGVRNVDEGFVEFRFDGQLIGTASDSTGSVDSGQSVWIGIHLNRYFEGVIDDIHIYRQALTAEEALALYNAPNPVGVNDVAPSRIGILKCYPSPFNPQMTITFTLIQPQQAKVAVYDLTGRLLRVLADRSYDIGNHSIVWNGKDAMGRAVPSGTYVVRLSTENDVQARKVMLIR